MRKSIFKHALYLLAGRKPDLQGSGREGFTELFDLYPTLSRLCGLEIPNRIQGKDISRMLDDPNYSVRDTAFSVAPSSKCFLLRDNKWAYIQYEEDASGGIELFDMVKDPKQYTNLASNPEYQPTVAEFKAKFTAKMKVIRTNALVRNGER